MLRQAYKKTTAMPLDLRVPAERAAPPRDLEVRPKQVKAWLESLPLAQTFDSAGKLVQHLAALNRSRIDADERVQILEAYRPIAAVLLEELDDVYAKSPQPLAPRAREALNFARSLAAELSAGYKIVILEKSAKRLAFGVKKQLPPLMLRAMQYLVAEMRASYKSYSPVPQGVWHELHKLYLHAEAEGIAIEIADAEAKTTIAEVYCESLLVALTDPYRLVPGELDKIVGQIRVLRAGVTLQQKRPDTRPGAHFIVPCDTDKPPKPALSASDDTGGANWRLLDANAIVDKLRARKQAMDTGNVSATMSKMVGIEGLALITKLVTLWGDPPKRAYRRDPADITVAICVGFKAIGHFVGVDAKMDAEAQQEALRKGITMPIMNLAADDPSRSIPIFEWTVVNQSAGGLKVRRAGMTPQPIAVGEILGVKVPGKPHWTASVARWITALDDGGMEFGLQFIAPAACPVWIQPTAGATPQAKLGLLLTDADEADGELLVTPPNTYSDLREFELKGDDMLSRVRAGALIEKTARFELFHVSPS
jgi:cyclic-di-GMP-binding protein